MSKKPPERLQRALDLAEQIKATLPPPKPKRDQRILVAWGKEEYDRVRAFAEERGEPLAVAVRNLTLAALKVLSQSGKSENGGMAGSRR